MANTNQEKIIVDVFFHNSDNIIVLYKETPEQSESDWKEFEVDRGSFHEWIENKFDLKDYEEDEEVDMESEYWTVSSVDWSRVAIDYYSIEHLTNYLQSNKNKF